MNISLKRMVQSQIEARGITDAAVLEAMRTVERARFVPAQSRSRAYDDCALPIGYNQTISQPYIVAYMTDAAKLNATSRVLEVGTGSGYQTAILAQIAEEVYTIEIVAELAEKVSEIFEDEGYDNITVRVGDAYHGWQEFAPFDVIFVTCAPNHIPEALIEQLADGGRLIIPVKSTHSASLNRYTKRGNEISKEELLPVIFVPMTGQAQEK